MTKICYEIKRFNPQSRRIIRLANEILESYAEQGFVLTLRQLYYQFVARDLFPESRKFVRQGGRWIRHGGGSKNAEPNYKWLGAICVNGRLGGYLDWDHLEDRVRSLALLQHFEGPQDALDRLASWYHVDMWERQKHRPEVWVEKDALVGVIRGVCDENDVPYFVCRGYTSASGMHVAAQRLRYWSEDRGQTPIIYHLGDHDPSGVDMSRDIQERLQDVFNADCVFKRIALTMGQVEETGAPPDPAKPTDSRHKKYVEKYGDEAWELDALPPDKFRELIQGEVDQIKNDKQWKKDARTKAQVKGQLVGIAKEWGSIPGWKRTIEKQRVEIEEGLENLSSAEERIADLELKLKKRMTKKKRKPDA